MGLTCDICSFEAKNGAGLSRHMALAHGIKKEGGNMVEEKISLEEVRRIVQSELESARTLESLRNQVTELQRQLQETVPKGELQKREDKISELVKQVKGLQQENERLREDFADHTKLGKILLSCPECLTGLAKRAIQKFYKERPGDFQRLVCDATGCRWVRVTADDVLEPLKRLEERHQSSAFTIGSGENKKR